MIRGDLPAAEYTTTIEEEIQRLRLTAPRVTPEHIESVIISKQFIQPSHSLLTLCVLKLRNGFNVMGESACVSKANFNLELGQRIALENAKSKIWALEGYALAERLHAEAVRNAKLGAGQGLAQEQGISHGSQEERMAQGQIGGAPK